MTQLQLLADLDTILVQFVFIVSVLFIVGTSLVWPWWRNDFGWTIVLKTAAIAIILLRAVLHDWFNLPIQGLAWDWIGTVSFAAIGGLIIWRFVVIWVIQRYNPPPTKSARYAWHHRLKHRNGDLTAKDIDL